MQYRKSLLVLCTALLISVCALAGTPLAILEYTNASSTLNSPDVQPLSPNELVWEKTYGGAGDDRAFCLISKDNNGFLIVGSSTSFIPGKTIAWVVRTDSDGNTVWNKTYPNKDGTEFRSALKTTGGFLLVGNSFFSSGDEDAWIMKIDDQGDVLWNKTIGENNINKILSAASAPDGFVFVGLTYPLGNNNSDGWAIKTDEDGKLLWNKTFGGPGNDAFRSIFVNRDGEYVIAGYTDSTENENYGFWLVKTDKNGTIMWNQTYAGPESKAYALTGAEDGYILVGDTHSNEKTDVDALIVKTDLNGKLVWERTWGGDNFDEASTVINARDEGYVIAGFTFSYGKGQRDFWTFKIDDFGNVLWSRTYGRENYEEAYAIVEVGDNEFVVGGWTNSIGAGSYDYYVIRMKLAGSDSEFAPRALGYYVLTFLGSTAIVLLCCLYFQVKRRKTN